MRHAAGIVNDIVTGRMRQFQRIAEHEVPALCTEYGLDVAGRAAVSRYVEQLQDWMAGVVTWHRQTKRYDEVTLRKAAAPLSIVFSAPTGLGTSAARLRKPVAVGEWPSTW